MPQPTPLPSAEALFDAMADAIYLIDPASSRIFWGNRAAWAMLGLRREQVVDHSVLSLQMDVTGLPQWTDIAAAIRANACYTFVGRHRHVDGHEVAVEVNTTAFVLDGREFFLSVARDIGRRLALENELKARENQLWFALNEAADGLWDWDIAHGQVFFSPQLERMLGYGPNEMSPTLATWADNIHPDDAGRVRDILSDHLAGRRGRYEAEYRLRNRNGHYLWVRDLGKVSDRDATGQPTRVVGMVQDVTHRKALELRLEELASNDFLTGVPNRRQGMAYLEAQHGLCERLGVPLGLCFIDVDHFKAVNDQHGHAMGDKVLQQIAQTVQQGLRREDMVCRWGGEEFIVIAPGANAEQARQIGEKACQAVRRAFDGVPGLPPVTISVGVAALPHHATELPALIERADVALYCAKQAGRDQVCLATR